MTEDQMLGGRQVVRINLALDVVYGLDSRIRCVEDQLNEEPL